MSDQPSGSEPAETQSDTPSRKAVERVPAMQRLLDNHFLLLFLGITMPTVFYLIWGILEVAQIPIAPR